MRLIAIDPGMTGGIALYSQGPIAYRLEVVDMPVVTITKNGKNRTHLDLSRFIRIISDFGPVDMVILEEAQARRQDGAQQAFTYGRSFGRMEGILTVLERPITYVKPQVWTKALGVGADKELHVERAKELFPVWSNDFVTPRGRKLDGRADAALILHWYKETH